MKLKGIIGFIILFFLVLLIQVTNLNAQVVLNADGPGETYELINSVLAPGYNVVEVPDCAHPEFGRHIEEVYDSTLARYVFVFHIHVTPDNDRCIKFDRQRNEIKTYDKSPDNLKAVAGETVTYEWKFKIDSFFQSSSSFTHLHQLKAVGGPEESMPLITLTARLGSPDKLELRYSKNLSQSTIHKVDLDPLKGNWVDVKEVVTFGESGSYNVVLSSTADSSILMTYANDDIRMWKTDASFIRPKWGIYRSLNHPEDLRDEMVYFSDFIITEDSIITSNNQPALDNTFTIYPNPARDYIQISNISLTNPVSILITDEIGRIVLKQLLMEEGKLNISQLDKGIYIIKLYNDDRNIATSKFLKY